MTPTPEQVKESLDTTDKHLRLREKYGPAGESAPERGIIILAAAYRAQADEIAGLKAKYSDYHEVSRANGELAEELARVKSESDDRLIVAEGLMASESTLRAELEAVKSAAKKWPRCCDLWQDSMGGRACTDCEQKTFAMMRAIQSLLGIRKDGAILTPTQEVKP